MTKDIRIQALDDNMLTEAVETFLLSFRTEAFTAAWLDLSQEKQRRLYSKAVELKFRLYLKAGQPIFSAVEDGGIEGLLVLKSPHISIPKGASLRELIPRLPGLFRLIPYFFRAIPLAGLIKSPQNMPEPYVTLEAVAVPPAHQGKGIGRMLLERAEDYCFSSECTGIYLFTGDEKNRQIYERFGYQVLVTREARGLKSYHMFMAREN